MAEINGDEILGKDINAPTQISNIFRARFENNFLVLDFGYVPPVQESELAALKSEQVRVSQRMVMPAVMGKMLIDSISELLSQTQANENKVSGRPPRPTR